MVIGCSKRSEQDKDVSFHRIPAIIRHMDKCDFELSKKRREGFFAAISREDVDFNAQHYRICSRHFKFGEPMRNLYDTTNPDWLPTQNLGHTKKRKGSQADISRYKRAKTRAEESASREQENLLLYQQAEVVTMKEIELIVVEEIEQLFDEIVEELAKFKRSSSCGHCRKLVNEHVALNIKEIVREEIELEIIKLSEGKCKCSNQIKVLNEELESVVQLLIICQQSSNCSYHHSVRSHLKMMQVICFTQAYLISRY